MIRFLDSLVRDREQLKNLRSTLEKVEKVADAVKRGAHFADILADPAVVESLRRSFGGENLTQGLQFLVRIALSEFSVRSFNISQPIEGPQKLEFLHRSMGGWRQFQIGLVNQLPDEEMAFVQPQKAAHWKQLQAIPKGSMITVYARTSQGKRSLAQEALALERCEAVFEAVQDRALVLESPRAAPAVERTRNRPVARKPARNWGRPTGGKIPDGPPVFSLKVTINKTDTFVHAGNAQLIISHLRDYAGQVAFWVLRGEKKPVRLDADSIWSAEIRNGETVVFDFFGPPPGDDFVKDLAKKVNKYTQMDKVANE